MLKMRGMTCCLSAALVCGVSALPLQAAAPDSKADTALVGDWRGTSICVLRPSACHDEDSLYHVSPIGEKPGRFSMKADKIVDDKPVTMGTVECGYKPETKTLACDFDKGSLELLVEGDTMHGTMKLKDGTLWRRISFKKTAKREP